MYEIQKGIELPDLGGKPRMYPFEKMEVLDSFFVPLDGHKCDTLPKLLMSMRGCIRSAREGKRYPEGWKFALRTDKENNGVRCWRVK